MYRFILVVFCLVTAMLIVTSCAENGKDGRDGVDLTPKAEAVMSDRGCVTCHADFKTDVVASKHMTNTFQAFGDSCNECHSPTLGYADLKPMATSGVACLSCHTYNKDVKDNPIHTSYATDPDACVKCHTDVAFHAPYHVFPYSDNISGDYGLLKENKPGHSFASGKAINNDNPRACGICHSSKTFSKIAVKVSPRAIASATVGAAKVYRTSGGASEKLYGNFSKYAKEAEALHLDRDGSDRVSCDGCHKPHSTELLTKDVMGDTVTTDDSAKIVASAEFMLCTSCHLVNVQTVATTAKTDTTVLSPLYVGNIVNDKLEGVDTSFFEHHGLDFSSANQSHTILDTHFKGQLYKKYAKNADGSIKVENTEKIDVVGYNIRANAKNACTSCHNPHASSVFAPKKDDKSYRTIAESWATTMHSTQTRSTNCVPCHAVGRQYAYVMAGAPIPTVADATNVQVTCMTCHMGDYENTGDNATIITGDNAKKLRVVKTFEEFNHLNSMTATNVTAMATITEAEFNAVKERYPQDNVMLCGGCHAGGRYGTVRTGYNDNGTAITLARPHHLMSFGTWTGTAFDLTTNLPAGKTYTTGPRSVGAHTSNGCLSCHMANSETHSFDVYAGTGKTTLLTKNQVCLTCHGGGIVDMTTTNYKQQVADTMAVLSTMVVYNKANFVVNAVTDPAERNKKGIAANNIVMAAGANTDKGLFAHTNKIFLQDIIYDNLCALQTETGVTCDPTSGKIDFSGAKTMETTSSVLTDAQIAILTNFFTGYTR